MEVEAALERVRQWCEEFVPEPARERVRVVIEPDASGAVIVELRGAVMRAGGWARREVARLRWVSRTGTWSLDWHDGRRWRHYSKLLPTAGLEVVLAELARDSCGLFWPRSRRGSGGEERRADVALA